MASTCKATRAYLRQLRWEDGGPTITVVGHYRDLGTHISLDNSGAAPTVTTRFKKQSL